MKKMNSVGGLLYYLPPVVHLFLITNCQKSKSVKAVRIDSLKRRKIKPVTEIILKIFQLNQLEFTKAMSNYPKY